MIDHKKIEDAINSYFKNTPTAKIIENLDRLSADRDKDLDRENINHQAINHKTINHKTTNNKDSIVGNLVRFEEVSPANQDAAFLAVSIEQLVAHLGLPLYEGYDDLDEMRLTFLTLPSGETVTVGEYLNCPQPGTSIYVDAAMQNIPQIVFDSCLQLQVAREEVIWFHPDWQDEIDRLYVEHGLIERRPELSQPEELTEQIQYEPIDCFNHALRIYTREYVPATYWAMLQHNLGLAYQNRIQGNRGRNLEQSIECFNNSLEIYTQDDFPEKWKINQHDLMESQRLIKSFVEETLEFMSKLTQGFTKEVKKKKKGLVKDIIELPISSQKLAGANLSGADLNGAKLAGANLSGTDLGGAKLNGAKLNGADLVRANLSMTKLSIARLQGANLSGANLSNAELFGADFSGAKLIVANLSGANLSLANLNGADFSGANLSGANLIRTKLHGTNLSGADVNNARFISNSEISESMKQNLRDRGAIFVDDLKDRSESKNLVPR
jgi:uncharacterized protein YjbI with pentapeptide repeats